nr:hypothetical protein [Mycolicibacterium peregrinum]
MHQADRADGHLPGCLPQRRDAAGGLGAHRRRGSPRRRRVPVHRRPQAGPDRLRRIQRLPPTGRGRAEHPRFRRPGRGHRCTAREVGEAVLAVIVTRAGVTIGEQELIDYVKAELGSVCAPKTVVFVDEVPLSATGKVDKKSLREPYWQGQSRQVG